MKNPTFRQLLYTFIPGIFILILIVSAKIFLNHSLLELTSDVSEVAVVHPLAGILSNLGILLWSASVSILFFSAFSLYNYVSRSVFLFLVSSAIFTGYLLTDDMFSIHEMLALIYLGVNETIIYLLIAITAIIYFITFFRIIYSTKNFVILFIAIGLLGFSLISDTTPLKPYMPLLGDWRHLLEEGTKWLGICCWSSYFIITSFNYLKENLGSQKADSVD